MKREPCPICKGDDIQYSEMEEEYFCNTCQIWPTPLRTKALAGIEWDKFARGPK